ncbi:MAG: CPBP family intramembrane metalloprotease [Planctomycetes bacterium]|nr:CPBP family intramembrane metalloprotease [Planctomycetota bacterium]
MSPHELNQLRLSFPAAVLFSLPFVFLIGARHATRIPFLRLERPKGPREPLFWGLGEAALVIVVWFLSQIFVGPWVSPFVGRPAAGGGGLSEPAAIFLVELLSTVLAGGFVLYLLCRVYGQPARSLGLARTSPWNAIPVLLLAALSYLPLQVLMALWAALLHDVLGSEPAPQKVVELFQDWVRAGDAQAVGYLLAGGVLVAPLGEELLFRGVFYGALRERWGRIAGAAVSSFLFAGLHGSLGSLLPLAVVGCLLCYVYERTGSLLFAMLFHAVFNGNQFAIMLYGGAGP